MTDRDLDALRGLRRELASVPPAARLRGLERLEALVDRRPGDRRRGAAGRWAGRALGLVGAAIVIALALAAGGLVVLGHGPRRPETTVHHRAATRASLVAMLGVLRRPQTAAERALVHRAATDRYAALPQFSDPDSVRFVAKGVFGRHVFLYLEGTTVCVYYPDVEGGGIGCATAPQLERNRTMGGLGTEVFGLVPDDVAQVELTFPSGRVSIAARHNFWQTRVSASTRTAIVWRDAQAHEVDPADARQQGIAVPPPPPKVKVTTTELHARVDVLSGHRVRFTPKSGRHKYVISLQCGRSGFDGAITKRLPAGQAATVPLELAAARDQCPGRHVLAGVVRVLPPASLPGSSFHQHVIVLGRFRLTR